MELPTDAQARKAIPLATGLLDYFPSALVAVAALSAKGNDQHSPGKPLHWDRAKSGDEADALMRHLMQRGTVDTDGVLHSTKVAWRALAMLQKELEAAGAPVARGARVALEPRLRRFTAEEIAILDGAPATAGPHEPDRVLAQQEAAEAGEDVIDALNFDRPEADHA